ETASVHFWAAFAIVELLFHRQNPVDLLHMIKVVASKHSYDRFDALLPAFGMRDRPGWPCRSTGAAGISVIWRGAWQASANYLVNDAVSFNGSSYIGATNNSGIAPDICRAT